MDTYLREFKFQEGEVFLINKPYRWTSFDIVNNIRIFLNRDLGIKKIKVGHTGTLDPLATGLLIICTGKQTKKIEEFQMLEKEYTGTFTIGATTPSFDKETEINREFVIDHISNELIHQAAQKFLGTLEQTPPLFSAIKIDGKRAYEYARNNDEVKIKSKTIHIYEFEITEIRYPGYIEADFRVKCSKGTYIRSLARDFGKELNSGAFLSSLCRTKIGHFLLKNAYKIEDLKKLILQMNKPGHQIET